MVLKRKLAAESYVRDMDKTLDNAMKEFEEIKKEFTGTQKEHFTVPGLKPNDKKGFTANRLWLTRCLCLRQFMMHKLTSYK